MQSDSSDDRATALLMHMLGQVKRIDMRMSMDIAGLANCVVRDHNGNLLPFVWTRQSINNEHENATLLTRDMLQKHLSGFIEAGVAENLTMLQKVSDPAVLVDWVVRTAEHWERRYAQKRDEKYDISQTVLSSMLEAVHHQVLPTLLHLFGDAWSTVEDKMLLRFAEVQHQPMKNKFHSILLQHVCADTELVSTQNLESVFWLHRGQHALMRLLFRIGLSLPTSTSDADRPNKRRRTNYESDTEEQAVVSAFVHHLCLITAKLLQKKEVCNKAGAYSSNRQRSDVMQEYNNVVINFRVWLQNTPMEVLFTKLFNILQDDTWIFYVVDHTSIPVTLAHMHAPVPKNRLRHLMQCPHCKASFAVEDNDKQVFDEQDNSASSHTQNGPFQ